MTGRRRQEAGFTVLDLRGLSPPEPLVAILREVQGAATPVIVELDRDPVMLYPELASLGWVAEPLDAPRGGVRLQLSRGGWPRD
jgi:hypothetical protein